MQIDQEIEPYTRPFPRRRPLSLLDLPPETLSTIVEMCKKQDEAFRFRAALIREESHSNETQKILKAQETAGFGSSLNAIFLLSRVTNKIAAPHIFETVKASSITDAYHFWISPRHLRHFKHVVLDGNDPAALKSLVASLGSIKKLNELTIHADSARLVFGADAHRRTIDSSSPALWRLRDRARSVRTLHLVDFDFEERDGLGYLRLFDRLTSLALRGSLRFTDSTTRAFVASIRGIKDLTLDPTEFGPSLPEAFVTNVGEWPALEALHLKTEHDREDLSPAILRFIERFGASLRRLTIETVDDSYLSPLPLRPLSDSSSFPMLSSISVIGSSLVAKAIFSQASKEKFPALSHLRLSYDEEALTGFAEDDSLLEHVLKNHRLRSLRYGPKTDCLYPEDETFLHKRAAELDFVLEPHHFPPSTFPDSWNLESRTTVLYTAVSSYVSGWGRSKRTEVEERFRTLRDYLDGVEAVARATGNFVELERLLQHLRPVEYDRLAQRD